MEKFSEEMTILANNEKMQAAQNVKIALLSKLDDWDGVTGPVDKDLRQVVVQKTSIIDGNTYVLQHVAGDNFVYRGQNGNNVSFNKQIPVLHLTGTAAGHTQTLEYAGRPGQWFVGTKPNDLNPIWSTWSKQIARIKIPHYFRIIANTKMQPRLSNLNYAGADLGIGCAGNQFSRVEAAVSPDLRYFLLAYGDNDYTGYFALYYLAEINKALDEAATASKYVDIRTIKSIAAFKIPQFSGRAGLVGSLQGFAIDNNRTIYVSSQFADDRLGQNRKIVKIPWGEADPAFWELVNLANESKLEIPGYYTELEGIQLATVNDLYLTVAYHQSFDPTALGKYPTKINQLYEITWDSNSNF